MLDRRGAELSADFVDADFALEILPGDHWIPDHHPAELAAIVLGRIASAR